MKPKKHPLLSQTEKQIENMILQYLFFNKIFAWKCNSVGVYDSIKKVYRKPKSPYIINGVSDIIGVINCGKHTGKILCIEVKTPARKNTVSKDQKIFLDSITANGGLAFVATSLRDVQEKLKELE